jgi:hypothetical protein
VRVQFHWVCPPQPDTGGAKNAQPGICNESDFSVNLTLNGKVWFTPNGGTTSGDLPGQIVPQAPCGRGYLRLCDEYRRTGRRQHGVVRGERPRDSVRRPDRRRHHAEHPAGSAGVPGTLSDRGLFITSQATNPGSTTACPGTGGGTDCVTLLGAVQITEGPIPGPANMTRSYTVPVFDNSDPIATTYVYLSVIGNKYLIGSEGEERHSAPLRFFADAPSLRSAARWYKSTAPSEVAPNVKNRCATALRSASSVALLVLLAVVALASPAFADKGCPGSMTGTVVNCAGARDQYAKVN